MSLEENLGPFAGKFIDEIDPSSIEASQQTAYEFWVAKECGHYLVFEDAGVVPDSLQRHVQRLAELKGSGQERLIEQIRVRYRTIVDQRLEDLRRNREQSPLDDFMSRHAQCYHLATQIVASLDDHLGVSPETVTWKHVADLWDAKKRLDSAAYLLRLRGPED
jgi:hypothetical protein